MPGDRLAEIPESSLNDLLRRVDWRFLLSFAEVPRTFDLTSGRISEALDLISAAAPDEVAAGTADLAVTGYPSEPALSRAAEALRPHGELVCCWRVPRPGGASRARARLLRAGFADVRLYWPGPTAWRPPQFWLPLECDVASRHLLAQRPPRSRRQALLRPAWRIAARAGLLSPLFAVARLPGPSPEADGDSSTPAPTLLLTGGGRSINKVVALPFAPGRAQPSVVVKFARVPEADAALEREAEVLETIERERPTVAGVPRVQSRHKRVGRQALTETAIHGRPLIETLAPESFERLAGAVTDWLAELAGGQPTRPADEWWERLVGGPLSVFERDFGESFGAERLRRCRDLLEGLGDLPLVPEHRDCSPWNVILGADGAPALLDWESAEPRGLPGLDLAYFLANAGFVLDRALESGLTRESHRRLLDEATPYGRIAARCGAEYCRRLGLARADFGRLRLLAWIVHSRSDHRHLAMEASGAPSDEALRETTYLGLATEEATQRCMHLSG